MTRPTDFAASRTAGRLAWAVRETRLPGWTLLAVLLFSWEIAARSGWIGAEAVPAVSLILGDWWQEILSGTLLEQLGVTLQHMAYGYAIGALAGVSAGVALGYSRAAWNLFEPIIEITRPVPTSALVPLFILFLGIDEGLKITVVAIATFFPVFMNSYAGVKAVSRTMRDTGRTFGLGGLRLLLRIVLPAAAPMVFVGLRYAVAVGLVVALVSEMIAGNNGMGYYVIRAQQNLNVVQLFIGVFTLALLGYALNALFLVIENVVLPWHAGSRRREAA